MFHGLSAFPLTPLKEGTFDEHAFINLLRPVVDAGVDSLGILGSTGSYAYLTVEKRGRIARCAVAHADDIPAHCGWTIFCVWLTTRNRQESPAYCWHPCRTSD